MTITIPQEVIDVVLDVILGYLATGLAVWLPANIVAHRQNLRDGYTEGFFETMKGGLKHAPVRTTVGAVTAWPLALYELWRYR